jgi:stage II sporulation protein AA (anti-sigma F factor antagonist)
VNIRGDTLIISSEFRKGILFIRLKGRFTKEEANYFKEEVIDKIEKCGIRSVVFNIDELSFIDLKGIHSMFYVYEMCDNNSGKVLLCKLYDSPVFERMKKNRIFKYVHLIKNELEAFDIIKI